MFTVNHTVNALRCTTYVGHSIGLDFLNLLILCLPSMESISFQRLLLIVLFEFKLLSKQSHPAYRTVRSPIRIMFHKLDQIPNFIKVINVKLRIHEIDFVLSLFAFSFQLFHWHFCWAFIFIKDVELSLWIESDDVLFYFLLDFLEFLRVKYISEASCINELSFCIQYQFQYSIGWVGTALWIKFIQMLDQGVYSSPYQCQDFWKSYYNFDWIKSCILKICIGVYIKCICLEMVQHNFGNYLEFHQNQTYVSSVFFSCRKMAKLRNFLG